MAQFLAAETDHLVATAATKRQSSFHLGFYDSQLPLACVAGQPMPILAG